MGTIIALLVIASLSLLIVRIGSTALMMTGLTWDIASFQAYSAYFGVGFTTREAELVVGHPLRRRIVRDLILIGNIGLTTALATLVVNFVNASTTSDVLTTFGYLAAGATVIWIFSKIGILTRALDAAIRFSLKRAGMTHALDYELLLRVRSGYAVSEIDILDDSPLANKSLRQSRPSDLGVIVLGIEKPDNSFTGAPGPGDIITPGDVATVYGQHDAICNIAKCPPQQQ